jgi:hypothetical protein
MRIVETVGIDTIAQHLLLRGSAVSLPVMSGPLEDHQGLRVLFDASDYDRLILWFEFRKYTDGVRCKLTDMPDTLASCHRVKSFIDGDPALRSAPVDLRTTPNLEPVIVTDNLQDSILYAIDGSHRIAAQHLSHRGFQDVPAFAWVHPRMLEWAYIPPLHKAHKR